MQSLNDVAQLTPTLEAARIASLSLASAPTEVKNRALKLIAQSLRENVSAIVAANQVDLDAGASNGLTAGLLDRLKLDESRLAALANSVDQIALLTDPVGQVVRGSSLPNGIKISQVRVPFGVIGVIYEARPNVTIDLAALALKSGNAVVLRGGSAAENSNRILIDLVQTAIAAAGLNPDSVQTIDPFGRAGATELMKARGYVDVLIPRGSANLIRTVVTESQVPVIETGAGVVHIFLDETATKQWAIDIVHNSKTHRPSVCNALETLLVHRTAAMAPAPVATRSLTVT